MEWKIEIPGKLPSPNRNLHWTQRKKLADLYYSKIHALYMRDQPDLKLPATIIMTRIAPREYDFDNLVFCQKNNRDTIAQLFFPGLPRGKADNNPGFTWVYEQRKGPTKYYGFEIRVIT